MYLTSLLCTLSGVGCLTRVSGWLVISLLLGMHTGNEYFLKSRRFELHNALVVSAPRS